MEISPNYETGKPVLTKRIKLTEEDIFVEYFDPKDCGSGLTNLTISCGFEGIEKGTQLKQQILDDHKNNNPVYREFYEKWHHVLQENKRLKEELRSLKFRFCDEQDEINRITGLWRIDKQKLEQTVKEIKKLQEFHSGKGTTTQFSHADIFNELDILLKEILGDSTS